MAAEPARSCQLYMTIGRGSVCEEVHRAIEALYRCSRLENVHLQPARWRRSDRAGDNAVPEGQSRWTCAGTTQRRLRPAALEGLQLHVVSVRRGIENYQGCIGQAGSTEISQGRQGEVQAYSSVMCPCGISRSKRRRALLDLLFMRFKQIAAALFRFVRLNSVLKHADCRGTAECRSSHSSCAVHHTLCSRAYTTPAGAVFSYGGRLAQAAPSGAPQTKCNLILDHMAHADDVQRPSLGGDGLTCCVYLNVQEPTRVLQRTH